MWAEPVPPSHSDLCLVALGQSSLFFAVRPVKALVFMHLQPLVNANVAWRTSGLALIANPLNDKR